METLAETMLLQIAEVAPRVARFSAGRRLSQSRFFSSQRQKEPKNPGGLFVLRLLTFQNRLPRQRYVNQTKIWMIFFSFILDIYRLFNRLVKHALLTFCFLSFHETTSQSDFNCRILTVDYHWQPALKGLTHHVLNRIMMYLQHVSSVMTYFFMLPKKNIKKKFLYQRMLQETGASE